MDGSETPAQSAPPISVFLLMSLAPLLSQSPPLLCLCTLSIAVFTPFFSANLALVVFFLLFASLVSPLSSVHLVLGTMLSSSHSLSFLNFVLLSAFFICQSLHSSVPLSTLPCFLSCPFLPHPLFDSLHNPLFKSLLVSAPVVEG